MKIIENDDKKFLPFEKLKSGDVFKCGDFVYMKINAVEMCDDDDCVVVVNGVSLKDGVVRDFLADDTVEPMEKAKLILR